MLSKEKLINLSEITPTELPCGITICHGVYPLIGSLDIVQMATELLSLREQLAELKALPPVAWHTEDHDTDKSATTYNQEVAEQWKYKGWPVTELFTAAKPSED
ncbi:Uncharacterised protein [Yersinia pekkanenii]|uniref:Phage-like protein n=1 Tax=Yersinia pekkanenii TaxID=1288385 RepID=A0A0T9NWU4_9GAMM|nr:hypothetical protein [Yersinia pekkanenii]CNH34423.1 Uncharacterised protein [Yersinia pekkanenii]CRY69852.1 Uncharacterised protein [Yersinia pekkanenii]